MDPNKLKTEYQTVEHKAERLRIALLHEMGSLLGTATLAVPIESRVKTWQSIEERLARKPLELAQIAELDDLIGLRIILLFRRDLDVVLTKIQSTFDVISIEDKASTLAHEQFGYQSHHYVIRMPEKWLTVPSLTGLGDLKAEIQIRTMAQHMWAAASHKLQYKQEESVPLPLMRTIYRVSALLETVDLEFERVLHERGSYAKAISTNSPNELLNVDLLNSVLTEMLPAKNRRIDGEEGFAELLSDLSHYKIHNVKDLRNLLEENLPKVLKIDAVRARERLKRFPDDPRYKEGASYTFVGLTRMALEVKFGSAVHRKYMMRKYSPAKPAAKKRATRKRK